MSNLEDLSGFLIATIAQIAGHRAAAALSQTSHIFKEHVDAGLSEQAKELKKTYENDTYENFLSLKRTLDFAKRLPPTIGALDAPRATIPDKYEYVESLRQLCEGMPDTAVDVIASYSKVIPTLDDDTGNPPRLRLNSSKGPILRAKQPRGGWAFVILSRGSPEWALQEQHTVLKNHEGNYVCISSLFSGERWAGGGSAPALDAKWRDEMVNILAPGHGENKR